MNYKKTTIVLVVILVVTYVLNWQDIFNNKSTDLGMHKMSDGSMMQNDGTKINTDMHSMMMDMTANMKGKSGAELEKTFLTDMIVHHQGAVDMSKELLNGNPRPELVKFANDIINAQTEEIEMQKKWLKEWY